MTQDKVLLELRPSEVQVSVKQSQFLGREIVKRMSATAMCTHRCGAIRTAHSGSRVRLAGWVHHRRDLGGLVFIDLRDREGIVQVSFGPDWASPDVIARAAQAGTESVIAVGGVVASMVHPSPDAEPQSFEEAHERHSDAHAPLRSPPHLTLRFAGAARGMGAP